MIEYAAEVGFSNLVSLRDVYINCECHAVSPEASSMIVIALSYVSLYICMHNMIACN